MTNKDSRIFGYPGDGVTIMRRCDDRPEYDEECEVVKELPDGWMLVRFPRLDKEIKVSMADFGLIPYFEDKWNPGNWCHYI